MDRDCEIKCEIKKCEICHKYIEHSNQRVIVKHTHYHRCCLDNMWMNITCNERYNIINHFLEKERRRKSINEWLGCDI